MNRLCTICARGGSKGVKNKNIRPLHGKPLIVYSIEHAIQSNLFQRLVVSTDSDEIANIAQKAGAEIFFKRSKLLSSDTSGKLEVIRDAFIRSEQHFQTRFDQLIDLDATSPLRSIEDIRNAITDFEKKQYSNLFSVCKSRRNPYFNLIEIDKNHKVSLSKKLPNNDILRRQDAPKTYDMNASIYIWNRDTILNENSLFLDKTGIYIMPEERSFDIDTELDFKIINTLLKNQQNT